MQNLSKNNINILHKWYKLFQKRQKILPSKEAKYNWEQIKSLGIPMRKQENWKYISLNEFFNNHFIDAIYCNISKKECNSLSLKLHAYKLVFINGKYSSLLSDKKLGYWKIKTKNQENHQLTKKLIIPDIFAYLIESLRKEMITIFLPKEKKENIPLYLLHINQGSTKENTLATINYRHHIELNNGSTGKIIEHFVSKNNFQAYFNNTRTSIILNNSAKLKYIKLGFENHNSYHFGYNDIYTKKNSIFSSNTIMVGSKINRNQTNVKINGKNSNIIINSLLIPCTKNTIGDSKTYIEHNKSNCISRQLHKIIVHKYGKGIFDGIIKVKRCAYKTDSKMINHNLLLDKLAEINTKPQLNIYTDDVVCNHAATIGSIDSNQILYLRSRGISYQDAKKMIIFSFFADFLESIDCKILKKIIFLRIYEIFQNNKNIKLL
ncbi:MAG: Fe-S cluster scaffold complex subunit SufD [Candidatus Westeberhardia cardiocondylae]|nr:Fe-S cluster scaffold complex subunit SufD [Candidatus Westeberhardia cardiocondylae]